MANKSYDLHVIQQRDDTAQSTFSTPTNLDSDQPPTFQEVVNVTQTEPTVWIVETLRANHR